MDINEFAIGQRIAMHRVRRGLTQESLAGLVGISLSMMKKIESGDRLVTRFAQVVNFAQALKVRDLRELTGVPLPLTPDGRREHRGAEAVRTALLERGLTSSEPPNRDHLATKVSDTWQTWQAPSAFRYDAVGQQLPGLIRDAQAGVRHCPDNDRRGFLRLASTVYQLTRTWTKRIGEHELSLLAADRAVACALEADDPDLAGAAAWNLAMILSAQGRTEQARGVVVLAIEQLKPWLDQPSSARLAVYGGLHLMAATEAARDDHASEAVRLLDAADQIAAKTGETNHFHMVFGPMNAAIHRLSTAVELGRTSHALEIAEQVAVHEAQAVERRLTFHLDAARCYLRQRNDVAAVHMLQRIHQDSPEELRWGVQVQEGLRQLKGRAKRAIEADLQPLLAAAGLPD